MELKPQTSDETRAWDRALRQALPTPAVPSHFRSQLLTRLASESVTAELTAQIRADVEREWRQAQHALRRESVHLRWQTLAWLIGGAFTAGVVTMAAMPWVGAHFGSEWSQWVPIGVAVVGLTASVWGDARLRRWLGSIGLPWT